jgi:hypothetical protein
LKPQLVESQVAEECTGGVHGVQLVPQFAVELDGTQFVPHWWYPVSHENPHATPLHVEAPFTGGLHGAQLVPQVAIALSATHAVPHRW